MDMSENALEAYEAENPAAQKRNKALRDALRENHDQSAFFNKLSDIQGSSLMERQADMLPVSDLSN